MAGKALRIASVLVDFKSNDSQFQEAAKKTRTAVNRLRREMRPLLQTAKRLAIAFTGLATAAAFTTRRISAQIDQMAKFSRASRGTIRDMQILERSAGLQGIAFEKLQVSMKKLDVTLGQISDSTAYSLVTDQWSKLGLEIENVINLPLEERMRVILAAINEHVPAAQRAATATALFGARNAALMLQLSQGGAIQRATNEIEKYGGALTEAQKIGVEGFNDAIDELQHAVKVFSWQLVARHAPSLRRWAEQMAKGFEEGGKFRAVLERVATTAEFLLKTMANLTIILNNWINRTTAMIGAFGLLLLTIGKVIKMMVAFRNAIVASGLVIAALTTGIGGVLKTLAALGLAVAGTKAVMATLNDAADDHNTTLSKMNDNYNALIEKLDRTKGAMRGVWEETVKMTQASLDQMDVELERRATELGRSQDYKDALRDIREGIATQAKMTAEIQEIEQQLADPGFFTDTNTLRQRLEGLTAHHAAAGARVEASREYVRMRKAEIEEEERQLAEFRIKIERRIAEGNEPSVATKKRRDEDFIRANKDTIFGPIGLRPQDRDLDVSNRDTVWGPIGLRVPGQEDDEGPDHARAAQLRRRFEDANPFVQTGTYEKLRALHREYAAIRREITELGPTYANLQTMADQAFQTAKRHAMGITNLREEFVMLADTAKDRLRGTMDAVVDDFFDGTKKAQAVWRSFMRQIVKDAIWMRARSALSTVGNTIFGGIGSTLFPSPGIPGTNPGVALGGPHTIPQFASGGRHMGGPAWVGERGPELAWFDGPAQIYDAQTSRRMANSVNVDMALRGDVSAIADQIRNEIGAAAGPLAQQIMGSVNEQIRNPSDMRRGIRGAVA